MKPLSLFFVTALLLAPLARAAETYTIDPVHSTIGFKVRHLFTKVAGTFADVKGTITVDPDHPESASVQATIGVKSVSTDNAKRDADLRSTNFFDAEKFSEMTFKSKSVNKTGADTADVTGDLTLHGVTKPVTLHVKFLGKGANMGGGTTTGWEATATLKRSDFGLAWNKAIEGVAVVGDEVEVELEIAANAK